MGAFLCRYCISNGIKFLIDFVILKNGDNYSKHKLPKKFYIKPAETRVVELLMKTAKT